MEQYQLKKQAENIRDSLEEIQKNLDLAIEILSREKISYETMYELQENFLNKEKYIAEARKDFSDMCKNLGEFGKQQERLQENLIPYAKSIIYREVGENPERNYYYKYHNKPCRIVSESRFLSPNFIEDSSFAIQHCDEEYSSHDAWLCNLVIDVKSEDEKKLNDFGLVSKRQLEKIDHIISIIENLGSKKPKTPEEVFAKIFIKPFTSKHLQNAEDIKQGKMEKAAQMACYGLHEIYSDVSKEDYNKLEKLAQELSPVSLDKYWIKQQENKNQIQR